MSSEVDNLQTPSPHSFVEHCLLRALGVMTREDDDLQMPSSHCLAKRRLLRPLGVMTGEEDDLQTSLHTVSQNSACKDPSES